MHLTLDEENHIIGVDEENANYDYQGTVPTDFDQHKTDGYYMIVNQAIIRTPSVLVRETVIMPSSISKQLTNFAIMIAMNNSKGNEE